MRDYLFEEMLNRRANVTHPVVTVGADLLAAEPVYELAQAAVPLRLRPVRAALDSGLLGAFPQAEAVAYTLLGAAQAADHLGVLRGLTTLVQAAQVGDTAVTVADSQGLAPGDRLQLRDGTAFEEVTVNAVLGQIVTLWDPLENSFAAGANAEHVSSYEVLGVEQADGGHHLRLALRKR
jgi:hypothetical protein